jgi:hypothetical protein
MTAIRRPLVGIIALFLGALILDRLALARGGGDAVDGPAYLIAFAFVAAAFFIRPLRRARPGAIAGMSALAAAAFAARTGGLLADPYPALVESSLIVLAAVLGQHLAASIARLEQTLATVAFGESPALPLNGREAGTEILGEMARSRRHRRPLSVTVLAPDPASVEAAADLAVEEVHRAIRARYVHGKIARSIAHQLRRSDLLFVDPATGHFIVLSPETTGEGSELLVERIRQGLAPTRVRVAVGRAEFPDHALTFEQLVEHAQEQMRGQVAGDTGIDNIPGRVAS